LELGWIVGQSVNQTHEESKEKKGPKHSGSRGVRKGTGGAKLAAKLPRRAVSLSHHESTRRR